MTDRPFPLFKRQSEEGRDSLFRCYYALTLTFLVGTIISIVLFQAIINNNVQKLQKEFQNDVARQSLLLDKERRLFRQFLEDVQSFFAASEVVTRDEFLYFVNFMVKQNKVALIAWIPVEQVGPGKTALPVYRARGLISREMADVMIRTEAIQNMLRQATALPVFESSCTFPFVIEGDQSEPLIGLAVPTYKYLWHQNGKTESPLAGFVLAVFRIKPFITQIENTNGSTDKNFYVYIFDPETNRKELVFNRTEDPAMAAFAADGGDLYTMFPLAQTIIVPVGTHEMHLVVTPSAHFLSRAADWTAWVMLGLGMILTGAVAVFVQVVMARNLKIRETVNKRTIELRQSEERQKAILNNIADGVLTLDESGIVHMFNPACEHIFGYKARDVIGQNIKMLMPEPYWGDMEMLSREPGMMGVTKERKACRADGSEFTIEISIGLIRLDHRHHYVAVVRDTTERREAEDNLKRINQALDDFVYIVSHDLKEPLRSIQNFSAILQEDCSDKMDEEGRGHLETLTRVSRRMQEQLDSLLRYSRASHQEVTLEDVDVRKAVEEVLDLLHALIQQQKACVLIHDLPPVRCDRACLIEILTNLIQNALKYRREDRDPVIEVGSSAESDKPGVTGPVLYVRDNGIGIKKEHLGVIFKMFKRLHGRDKYGGGTGSGLAIVKKLVERHGGAIWVESEPGQGSVFYFTMQGPTNQAETAQG